ncbi:MAG: hypothetical protein RSF88_03840 [Lachnospiraceae bacterium]
MDSNEKNPACRILRLRRVNLLTYYIFAAVRFSQSAFYYVGSTFLSNKKKQLSWIKQLLYPGKLFLK